MKKYSTLLILIFTFVATSAGAVIQNSVTMLSIETDAIPRVKSVDLIVWSKWLEEKSWDRMGLSINVTSANGSDVDHGTQTHRFSDGEVTVVGGFGDEVIINVIWDDIFTGNIESAVFSACAHLIVYHEDNTTARGPVTCTTDI